MEAAENDNDSSPIKNVFENGALSVSKYELVENEYSEQKEKKEEKVK